MSSNIVDIKVFVDVKNNICARRFKTEREYLNNFRFLRNKIASVFPELINRDFKIYWKDNEDKITVSSDEELVLAVSMMPEGLRKFYVEIIKSNPRVQATVKVTIPRSKLAIYRSGTKGIIQCKDCKQLIKVNVTCGDCKEPTSNVTVKPTVVRAKCHSGSVVLPATISKEANGKKVPVTILKDTNVKKDSATPMKNKTDEESVKLEGLINDLRGLLTKIDIQSTNFTQVLNAFSTQVDSVEKGSTDVFVECEMNDVTSLPPRSENVNHESVFDCNKGNEDKNSTKSLETVHSSGGDSGIINSDMMMIDSINNSEEFDNCSSVKTLSESSENIEERWTLLCGKDGEQDYEPLTVNVDEPNKLEKNTETFYSSEGHVSSIQDHGQNSKMSAKIQNIVLQSGSLVKQDVESSVEQDIVYPANQDARDVSLVKQDIEQDMVSPVSQDIQYVPSVKQDAVPTSKKVQVSTNAPDSVLMDIDDDEVRTDHPSNDSLHTNLERRAIFPHIAIGLKTLLSMGFKDDDGKLLQLLEIYDGNVDAILDIIVFDA